MAAHQGPRTISVSRETWMRLTARQYAMIEDVWERVTYDDVVRALLDEVEGAA